MKKRKKINLILLTFSIIFLTTFVSAQTNLDTATQKIPVMLSEFLKFLQLDTTLLASLLMGLLLWAIVYSIVVQLFHSGGKWGSIFATLVSLIIVILSMIALPENFIDAVLLQYGAMGAAIITIIPFMILLYFSLVVIKNLFIAKIIWIFYTVYYFSLFIFKIANAPARVGWIGWFRAANIPYIGAVIAGVFVIFASKWLRGMLFKEKLSAAEEKALQKVQLRKTLKQIQEEEAKAEGLTT